MADDIPDLHTLTTRDRGGVTFVPVGDPSVSVPPAPAFTLGNPAHVVLAEYYAETRCNSAGLYIASDIGLFERSLLIRDDTIFRCEQIGVTHQNVTKFLPLYQSLAARLAPRPVSGTAVLLLGRGYHVWGHWLIDFLPKLYLLAQAGHNLFRLKYLIPRDAPAFGREILSLLSIPRDQLIIYNPLQEFIQADQLVIPTLVRTGNRPSCVFKDAVTFATSMIWDRHPRPPGSTSLNRIFLSRGRLSSSSRRLMNRPCIERAATNAGFTVVFPETMSAYEQFVLFSHARHIAGDYGSALHTSIFSPPSTTVCALRGTCTLPGFVQSAIGDTLAQPTGYVFGEMLPADPTESFSISEDAFRQYLDQID